MATRSCPLPYILEYIGIQENAFYFQVGEDETDLQSDGFRKSEISSVNWITSKDLYLVVGDQFSFKAKSPLEKRKPDCMFTVQAFKEDPENPLHAKGRAVTLSARMKTCGKFKVVSCEQCQIKVETMDHLPEEIGDFFPALFFMKRINSYSESYFFESAAHESHFLGFEVIPGDDSMRKLVLRPKPDEVEGRCGIDVAPVEHP